MCDRLSFGNYPSPMKIILMRHGKPALENYHAIASRDMPN